MYLIKVDLFISYSRFLTQVFIYLFLLVFFLVKIPDHLCDGSYGWSNGGYPKDWAEWMIILFCFAIYLLASHRSVRFSLGDLSHNIFKVSPMRTMFVFMHWIQCLSKLLFLIAYQLSNLYYFCLAYLRDSHTLYLVNTVLSLCQGVEIFLAQAHCGKCLSLSKVNLCFSGRLNGWMLMFHIQLKCCISLDDVALFRRNKWWIFRYFCCSLHARYNVILDQKTSLLLCLRSLCTMFSILITSVLCSPY